MFVILVKMLHLGTLCTSLKLPHVICDYCNHIRDIDLCREEEINIWNCLNCHKAYNKIALEEEIINQFNKLFVKFMVKI